MKSKLNKFLRYLQIEKGFSQGNIKAYQLDIEKGLISRRLLHMDYPSYSSCYYLVDFG